MAAPEFCARCGEEVRHGWRAGPTAPTSPGAGFWMHRDPSTDLDHPPLFGQPLTAEMAAEIERQLDLPRTKLDADGNEVVYTTRNWRSKKVAKKTDENSEAETAAAEEWDGIIPEPEIRADHTVVPWPLRESVPGGVWLVLKPALNAGLEVARLTFARGTWLRADSQRPSVCDTWVLAVRVPGLDVGTFAAVGCWRNTGMKWQYEHGLLVTDRTGEFVSAAEIKQWIKSLTRDTPPTEEAE